MPKPAAPPQFDETAEDRSARRRQDRNTAPPPAAPAPAAKSPTKSQLQRRARVLIKEHKTKGGLLAFGKSLGMPTPPPEYSKERIAFAVAEAQFEAQRAAKYHDPDRDDLDSSPGEDLEALDEIDLANDLNADLSDVDLNEDELAAAGAEHVDRPDRVDASGKIIPAERRSLVAPQVEGGVFVAQTELTYQSRTTGNRVICKKGARIVDMLPEDIAHYRSQKPPVIVPRLR